MRYIVKVIYHLWLRCIGVLGLGLGIVWVSYAQGLRIDGVLQFLPLAMLWVQLWVAFLLAVPTNWLPRALLRPKRMEHLALIGIASVGSAIHAVVTYRLLQPELPVLRGLTLDPVALSAGVGIASLAVAAVLASLLIRDRLARGF